MARIAIIGGGAAGAWMLMRLRRRGYSAIDIIEPRTELGRGLAYSAPSDEYLLNVPADKMDTHAEESDPRFVSWLAQTTSQFGSEGYAPRHLYGTFLSQAVATASTGADIRHIRSSATAIRRRKDGLLITLADGVEHPASAIVLALGNLPPKRLSPDKTDPRIIEDPWAIRPETMAAAKHILIAGTGLTTLDAVVAIARVNPEVRFTLAAAHPLLPPCDRLGPQWAEGEHLIGRSPSQIWNRAKQAMRSHPDAQGWYEIVDGLRPHVETIWADWTQPQRRSFVKWGARLWLHHRHRSPPATWHKVNQLAADGRLSLRAGRVRHLDLRRDKIAIDIGTDRIAADLVVNATGPSLDLASHPLLRQLLEARLITKCPLGLGLEIDDEGRCRTADGLPSRLFALGTLTRGQFFETVAVPHIMKHAANIANALSASIPPR